MLPEANPKDQPISSWSQDQELAVEVHVTSTAENLFKIFLAKMMQGEKPMLTGKRIAGTK